MRPEPIFQPRCYGGFSFRLSRCLACCPSAVTRVLALRAHLGGLLCVRPNACSVRSLAGLLCALTWRRALAPALRAHLSACFVRSLGRLPWRSLGRLRCARKRPGSQGPLDASILAHEKQQVIGEFRGENQWIVTLHKAHRETPMAHLGPWGFSTLSTVFHSGKLF